MIGRAALLVRRAEHTDHVRTSLEQLLEHRFTKGLLAVDDYAHPRSPRFWVLVAEIPFVDQSLIGVAPSDPGATPFVPSARSEEHTSEIQSLMRILYAVLCLKKKNIILYDYNSVTHFYYIESY